MQRHIGGVGAVSGNAIKFNPAYNLRVVIASTTLPFITNIGRYDVLDCRTRIPYHIASDNTSQHIFDCTWSRPNPRFFVVAEKNGGCHMIDVNPDNIRNVFRESYYGHTGPAVSVDWNPINYSFITASLDRSATLWFVGRSELQRTYDHTAPVNCAIWNPRNPNLFASASDDHKIRIWDARTPEATLTFEADDACSICTCDWNQHGTLVATGATGRNCVKVWDLRNTTGPVKVLVGDLMGSVIKVKFSRFHDQQVASSFSNGKVCVWENEPDEHNVHGKKYTPHIGAVRGLDMSELTDGMLASTGEDGTVCMWLHTMQEPPHPNGVQE